MLDKYSQLNNSWATAELKVLNLFSETNVIVIVHMTINKTLPSTALRISHKSYPRVKFRLKGALDSGV